MFFQLNQPLNCGSTRVSCKNTFFSSHFSGINSCIFVRYFFKSINDIEVDISRKNILTNSFGDVRINFIFIKNSSFVVFFKNRTVGINSPNFDIWIFFFQIPTHTRNGSSCSNPNNKMSYFTVGLFPNFRTSLFIMCQCIRRIVVLINIP